MIKYPKIYIGPMSKNIVDSVCDLTQQDIGLIPSRRQIEFFGGYVNKWKTKQFVSYVREKNKNIVLQRDHGGPDQGLFMDDGLDSLLVDCESNFDLIHIDPWKRYPDLQKGIDETIRLIRYCHNINKNCKYEIGTEQAIRSFTSKELKKIFFEIKKDLGNIFHNVVYGVVQGGTSIVGNINTGVFNRNRFLEMIDICKEFNLLSKEHNGDYLTNEQIKIRFDLGLDAINVAPEFGYIESKIILEEIYKKQDEALFESYYNICYKSKKWKKWLKKDFDLTGFTKHIIPRVSGHYVFAEEEFDNIKKNLPNIDAKIKCEIKRKVSELICLVK